MTTITKAQLEAQATELQQALTAAQARIDELQQQLGAQADADPEERRNQLEQTVWLQREAPSFERNTMRWSADGQTLLMRIGAQYATLDRKSGQRLYGERRWFTAIGEVAEQLRDLYASSDSRLVRIGAYERPQPPAADGTRRSEWILASVEPLARTPQALAPAPAQAFSQEPSEEEVPF